MLSEAFLDAASTLCIFVAMVAWWRVIHMSCHVSTEWKATAIERAESADKEWAWHTIGWAALAFAALFSVMDMLVD